SPPHRPCRPAAERAALVPLAAFAISPHFQPPSPGEPRFSPGKRQVPRGLRARPWVGARTWGTRARVGEGQGRGRRASARVRARAGAQTCARTGPDARARSEIPLPWRLGALAARKTFVGPRWLGRGDRPTKELPCLAESAFSASRCSAPDPGGATAYRDAPCGGGGSKGPGPKLRVSARARGWGQGAASSVGVHEDKRARVPTRARTGRRATTRRQF